jgi:polysaccharide pyruvyl transferase WcaK-like protein
VKALNHLIELVTGLVVWVPVRLGRGRRRAGWRVVITGWWGSETVGDVAILGQVLSELQSAWPGARLVVASFDRRRTARSLAELDRADVGLISVGARSAWEQALADAVVFGGGPLMESPAMPLWAVRAWLARLAGAQVVLHGCGLGPIRRRRTTWAVAALVRVAALAIVRDSASLELLSTMRPGGPVMLSFDPAYDYVGERLAGTTRPVPGRLLLFLRLPSAPYLKSAPFDPDHLIATLAAALDRVAERERVELVGLVMNTGHQSDDDHRVYEALRTRLAHPSLLRVAPGHHSLGDVMGELAFGTAALTIRFHGFVFALAAGVPCVAIDYAVPAGKVTAAASDAGEAARVVGVLGIDADQLAGDLTAVLARTTEPKPYRSGFAARRIEALRSVMT